MKKEYPVCPMCGSSDVLADAHAVWDIDRQEWVLQTEYDSKTCSSCGYESNNFNWVEVEND